MIVSMLITTMNLHALIFVSQPSTNKNNKNFVSSMQEDLVPINFGELFPEDKICKNDSKNMSVF